MYFMPTIFADLIGCRMQIIYQNPRETSYMVAIRTYAVRNANEFTSKYTIISYQFSELLKFLAIQIKIMTELDRLLND